MQDIRDRAHVSPARPVGILILLLTLVLSLSCSDLDAPQPSAPPAVPVEEAPLMWEGRPFAFTFTSDDGNIDNRVWVDVFRDLDLRYTMFVTARWIGQSQKLTVSDLRHLQAEGFEIGGHGLSHARLTDCTDSALVSELRGCRDTLQAMIGASGYRCRTFAYPYQAHDERVMTAATRFYTAARDGGSDARGYPDFSRGNSTWGNTSLFEVPVTLTLSDLVNRNQFTEMRTRINVRNRLADFRRYQRWVVVTGHRLGDCDSAHMRWVLEELQAAGAWIAPFSEVAACYRRKVGLPPYTATPSLDLAQ